MSFKRAAAENGFISSPSKNFRASQPHLLCHKVILQVIRGNYTMSLYRTVQKYIFRLAKFYHATAAENSDAAPAKYPLLIFKTIAHLANTKTNIKKKRWLSNNFLFKTEVVKKGYSTTALRFYRREEGKKTFIRTIAFV